MKPDRRQREARTGRRRGAFTIVELLVVISIILIVLSIGVVVTRKINEQAVSKAAMLVLTSARAAASDYQAQVNNIVNHLDSTTDPFDWSKDRASNTPLGGIKPIKYPEAANDADLKDRQARLSIKRFCWAATQVPTAKKTLQAIGTQKYFVPEIEFMVLLDPWGKPLAYAAYVSYADTGAATADDFLPEQTAPFFASAGPDGKWGDDRALRKRRQGVNLTPQEKIDATAAADNLYSFNLE
jgi:prepilin-type N-terminal cleavage/methylation domain-containing protein